MAFLGLSKLLVIVLFCSAAVQCQRGARGRTVVTQPAASTEEPSRVPVGAHVITRPQPYGPVSLKQLRSSGLLDALSQGGNALIQRYSEDLVRFNLTAGGLPAGGDTRWRSGLQRLPAPASCKPRTTVVSLGDDDPSSMVFPNCIEVNRCGGCCGHDLVECKPRLDAISMITVSLFKYTIINGMMTPNTQMVTKQIENHNGCVCQCKATPADCNPAIQYFSNAECQCMCNDRVAQSSCQQSNHHTWNSKTCTCECLNDCQTNFNQNPTTCECVRARSYDYRSRQPVTTDVVERPVVAPVVSPEERTCRAYKCPSPSYQAEWKETTKSCHCVRNRARG